MRHSPIAATLALCMCTALSACSPRLEAASIPLLQNGTGASLADALQRPWARQRIGEVSFAFPTHMQARRIGGEAAASALYELSGTGVQMHAFVHRYRSAGSETAFPTRALRSSLMTGSGCTLLVHTPPPFLDVDMTLPHHCNVILAAQGPAVTLLGYSTASEVLDLSSAILFLGEHSAVVVEHVVTLEQVSPSAQRMIDDYFREHPQLTRRWAEERSSQQLDRRLRTELDRALREPSADSASAIAFLERIARSMEEGREEE